jgi:hypothetical protein
MIDQERPSGLGVGYVDASLLAATRLTADSSLWMNGQRVAAITARARIGLRATPEPRCGDQPWLPPVSYQNWCRTRTGVVPEVVGAGRYARRVDDDSR